MEKSTWLVAHTRPQWERIVCKQLETWYHLPYYCPFQKVKRRYTDRIKNADVPLFKNYVFVQVRNYNEQIKVLQLDGVVDYVLYLGQPARLKDKEIELIREMVRDCDHLEVIRFLPGKVVQLMDGALKGFTGIVQEVSGKKVFLLLPQLGFKLEAWMDQVAF